MEEVHGNAGENLQERRLMPKQYTEITEELLFQILGVAVALGMVFSGIYFFFHPLDKFPLILYPIPMLLAGVFTAVVVASALLIRWAAIKGIPKLLRILFFKEFVD